MAGFFLFEGFGDLAKEQAAAAAEVLEDADAGTAGEEFFAKGSVEGGVDAIGDEDEVDVGIREEGAGLIGVSAADGVIVRLFILIEEAKDDLEDLGVFTEDQNIDGVGAGNWHSSAYLSTKLILCVLILTVKLSGSQGRLPVSGRRWPMRYRAAGQS